jgi:hypothetical protein
LHGWIEERAQNDEIRALIGSVPGATDYEEAKMAVGLRLKFSGGTLEQYEAVHGHMDVQNNPPEGLIFHSAGPIEGGFGVIDFWESREQFDRFVQQRLQPAIGELGDQAPPAPPDIREFPVHNILKP